jgi:hypothetical protein
MGRELGLPLVECDDEAEEPPTKMAPVAALKPAELVQLASVGELDQDKLIEQQQQAANDSSSPGNSESSDDDAEDDDDE